VRLQLCGGVEGESSVEIALERHLARAQIEQVIVIGRDTAHCHLEQLDRLLHVAASAEKVAEIVGGVTVRRLYLQRSPVQLLRVLLVRLRRVQCAIIAGWLHLRVRGGLLEEGGKTKHKGWVARLQRKSTRKGRKGCTRLPELPLQLSQPPTCFA